MLALAALAAAAHSGIPALTVQDDFDPYWSFDARYVAFEREEPPAYERLEGVWIVPAGHGTPRRLGAGLPRGFRPGGDELLVQAGRGAEVIAPDGRVVTGFNGSAASWSADGGRIAYFRAGTLYAVSAAGGEERALATGILRPTFDVSGPVWSPDGRWIAVATSSSTLLTSSILVVAADGSGSRTVFTGPNQNVNPTWSPDGSTLAFESNADHGWEIAAVGADGTGWHAVGEGRLPQWEPGSGREIAFISDREHVPGVATPYRWALYLMSTDGTNVRKIADDVHPYTPARWSPTGLQLAYAAGRECQRWGVYDVRIDAPHERRLTNDCHFVGTAGPDKLRGTPFLDFMRGLAGSDLILGYGGGDRIEGNGGNDTILAGDGPNAVFGGPGNDRIATGRGNDLVVGGPGRDTISTGLGRDRVEARDGARDVIDCGGGTHDLAEVDAVDVVRGCETVRLR